jgi:hypothetical protein
VLKTAIRAGGKLQAVAPGRNQSIEHELQNEQEKMHGTTPPGKSGAPAIEKPMSDEQTAKPVAVPAAGTKAGRPDGEINKQQNAAARRVRQPPPPGTIAMVVFFHSARTTLAAPLLNRIVAESESSSTSWRFGRIVVCL